MSTNRPTISPGDGDPRHGTSNGYTNLSCRCQPCRDAWAERHWLYMQRHPEQQEKARKREMAKSRAKGAKPRAESPRWPLCSVEDCPTMANHGVWCTRHYQRVRRHGSPYIVLRRGRK